MRRRTFPLALAVAGLAHANIVGPGIQVRQVAAPPLPLSGIQTLAVGEFSGTGGSTVADGIRTALQDPERSLPEGAAGLGKALAGVAVDAAATAAGSAVGGATGGIGGKATSKLVEGAGDAVIDQLGKDRVQLDDGLSIEAVKLAAGKADAVISGKVETSSKDEKYKAKQAKKDGKGNTVKDSKGNTVYEEVDCVKRTVTVSTTWSLKDASGKEQAGDTEADSASDSACGSEQSKVASKDALAARALGSPGLSIVNKFAPAWRNLRIDLDKDKAINDDIKLAKAGQPFMAACNIRRVLKDDSYNPDILYSFGGVLESLGHLDEASKQYTKAISASHKGAAKSLERLQKRQKELQVLQDNYGMTYTIAAPDWNACPATPDGRRTETKKEVELMSAAGGGEKVATLPKGMEVFVVGEEGEMAHVKLMGGDEGWIPAKAVK
jgi:hypothetical protein